MGDSRRDFGDEAIDSVFGAIVALILAAFFGYAAGSIAKKRQEEEERKRRLRLPTQLETSHLDHIPFEDEKKSGKQSDGFEVHPLVWLFTVITISIILVVAVKPIELGTILGVLVTAIGFGVVGYQATHPAPVVEEEPPQFEPDPEEVKTKPAVRYTITLPQGTEWEPGRAYQFMEAMLGRFPRLLFQIEAQPRQIAWHVLDLRHVAEPTAMLDIIDTFYPTALVETSPLRKTSPKEPFFRTILSFEHMTHFFMPMKGVEDTKAADPIASLVQELSTLRPGERVVYTLYVADFARFVYEQGLGMLTTQVPQNPFRVLSPHGIFQAGVDSQLGKPTQLVYTQAETDLFARKIGSFMYLSFLLIQVDAPTEERVRQLGHLDTHIWQLRDEQYNGLVLREKLDTVVVNAITTPEADARNDTLGVIEAWLAGERDSWRQRALILNASELAALWHLPHAGFTAPGIGWQVGKRLVAPEAILNNSLGVSIGFNRIGRTEQPVYLPTSERTSHMVIIGRTGVGKTSLIQQMVTQDIEQNRGVTVIDPHGQLTHAILQSGIPKHRANDVVILDLANSVTVNQVATHYPPPFNPLAKIQGVEDDIAAGHLMSVFERLYGEGFGQSQMGNTLNMALLTLSHEPTPTLLDIGRVLTEQDYRATLLAKSDSFVLSRFWERFDAKQPGEQDQLIYPILRRLDTFYSNRLLFPITCHPDPLNLAQLMAENKIILVSLEADRAKVPDAERLVLGAILISQLQLAAMSGAIKHAPYLLYIDEVQNFVTTSLSEMFSEARKFGLGLVVATQYFKRLAGDTLDAVMANVGTLVAFECDEADARIVSRYTKPHLDTSDLMSLGKYRAVISMRSGDGARQPAFTLETVEPPKVGRTPEAHANAEAKEGWLRRHSVENHTPKSYSEVRAWLDQRYRAPNPVPSSTRARQATGRPDDEFIEPRR